MNTSLNKKIKKDTHNSTKLFKIKGGTGKRKRIGKYWSYDVQQKKNEKQLSLEWQVKKMLKKKARGENVERCQKCKSFLWNIEDEQFCNFCDPEKGREIVSGKENEEQKRYKKKVQTYSCKLFKKLKFGKTEITDSRDKILYTDYDLETSMIVERKGWPIYWHFICCHGLQQTGHNAKSLYEFIKYLDKKGKKQGSKIVIRAHNGIKFDLKFWWKNMIEDYLKEDYLWKKENKKLLEKGIDNLSEEEKKKIKKPPKPPRELGGWAMFEHNNLLFINTAKILGSSIANLPCSEERKKIKEEGKELFSEKCYITGEYTEEFYKKLVRYCENDVRIQKENMDKLVNEIREIIRKITGKEIVAQKIYKKGTISALALYALRQIIPKKDFFHLFPNFSEENHKKRQEFVQNCYSGGLTDSWNEQSLPDTAQILLADMVSAFPSEMRNKPMPVGIGKFIHGIRWEQVNELKDSGFYQIDVEHLKLNQKLSKVPLIYEYGEEGIKKSYSEIKGRTLYYNGAEWKFINKYYQGNWAVYQGIEFETKTGLFNHFIDFFFNMKQQAEKEGDKFREKFAKLMLNCLYGRFGLNPMRSNYELIGKGKKKDENKNYFLHPIFKTYSQWEIQPVKRIKSFSYVPVAAQTTAYVRIKLMEMVIANQNNILYFDTDCVIIKGMNIIYPVGHRSGIGLGDWKHGPPMWGFDCIAPKIYRTHELIDNLYWVRIATRGYRKVSEVSKQISKLMDKYSAEIVKQEWNTNKREYILDKRFRESEIGMIIEEAQKLFPHPKENRKRDLVNGIWKAKEGYPEPDPNFLPFSNKGKIPSWIKRVSF